MATTRGKRAETATDRARDVFYVSQDEEYLRQLREEAAFWDSHPATLLSASTLPAVQRYLNERMTGDPDRQWFETIDDHDHGPFRRGCVLGAGPGHVETHLLSRHPELHLTVYDISGDTLARLRERLEQDVAGRAELRQEDLNFVTLPENTYDVFVADSSIHHILNLEHLAYQINRSLTKDGLFFMHDTVSESYFQFSEEKKRLFETLTNVAYEDPEAAPPIRWPDRRNWAFSPFESARSGEILEVFGRYLMETRVRAAYGLLFLALFAPPMCPGLDLGGPQNEGGLPWRARLLGLVPGRRARKQRAASLLLARAHAFGELLLAVDRIVSDTGYITPGLAFAIYRKRQRGTQRASRRAPGVKTPQTSTRRASRGRRAPAPRSSRPARARAAGSGARRRR